MSSCTPRPPRLLLSSLVVFAVACASGSVASDATPLNASPACAQNVVGVVYMGDQILLEDIHTLLVMGGREIDASTIQLVPAAARPEIRNWPEVARALERNYPKQLQGGRGVQVLLNILIDENGHVLSAAVRKSSGRLPVDRASVEVAQVMQFSPVVVGACRAAFAATMPLAWRPH